MASSRRWERHAFAFAGGRDVVDFPGGNLRNFEHGIVKALEAVLVSPRFLFRVEEQPATVRAGQTRATRERMVPIGQPQISAAS